MSTVEEELESSGIQDIVSGNPIVEPTVMPWIWWHQLRLGTLQKMPSRHTISFLGAGKAAGTYPHVVLSDPLLIRTLSCFNVLLWLP
jgi:hypothetical protein